MDTSTVRLFDCGLAGAVSATEDKHRHLRVGSSGLLADVSADVRGFHLFVGIPADIRAFVVQKNVGVDLGVYSNETLVNIGTANGVNWVAMDIPVTVKRAGRNVWTAWHTETPNRTDIWLIGSKGCFALYQIGVITHDDGVTWRLHGECRWKGRLFREGGGQLVAQPDEPRVKWGPFVTWKTVFDRPEFKKLLEGAEIQTWVGKPTDLEPPLPQIPKDGDHAVVQWYVPFAGQTGQGCVWMTNGGRDPACIHGVDLRVPVDESGVKRLYRGDVVNFSGTAPFGKKRSLKLLNVKLASRTW